MEKTEQKRYCSAHGCTNSFGTKDRSVQFFRTPDKASKQRQLWEEAIFGEDITKRRTCSFFKLCHLHFRPEDIVLCRDRTKLRDGAVPMAFSVVPKVEIKEEPDPLYLVPVTQTVSADTEKFADKSTSSAKNQLKHCENCIEANYNLQRALAKMQSLTAKLNMLKAENSVLKSKIQAKFATRSVPSNTKCELCRQCMTNVDVKQHICLDQDTISCTFCNNDKTFKSIRSLLEHLNYHDDDINEAKKNRLFKCGMCTLAYPLEILLKCHEKSHNTDNTTNTIQNDNVEIKSEPIDADADTVDDDDDVITVEIELGDSEGENGLENDGTVVVDLDELPEDVTKAIQSISASSSSFSTPNENLSKKMITKLFKCSTCGMAFETTREIACHVLWVHKNDKATKKDCLKKFTCVLCNETFTNITDYGKHIGEHERATKCEVCKLPAKLDTHLCGDQEEIQCDYCDERFSTTTKLIEHLKSHENHKFYHCKTCRLFFGMKFLRDCHEEQHVQQIKNYTCETCSKSFTREEYLIQHMKIHTKRGGFLCDECGKAFNTARNLENHKNSILHNSEPTIQCPECPKKFLRQYALNRHMDIHRDNKYVCDICQKELQSYNAYTDHMKRHRRTEADKKFECNVCSRKFFEKWDLTVHQVSHTNKKIFKCRFCKAAYKYLGDLNKHLKTHIGNKIYKCPKCPMRFQYPRELQKHSFKHYKQEKDKDQSQ